MMSAQWTPAQIAAFEKRIEEMEEKRRWEILHFSPDPYGEFGIPVWHSPLPVLHPIKTEIPEDIAYERLIDSRPIYALHGRVNAAIVGLLAMFNSCAVERIRPSLYPGFTYLTPEGVFVDIGALEDSALVFTRMTIDMDDGGEKDFTRIFELTSTGKMLAARLHILATLFDGGKTYELQVANNEQSDHLGKLDG